MKDEKITINEYIEEARKALEKEDFDDIKRNLREYLDNLENFTGFLFRDLGRVLQRRFPVYPSIRHVSKGYFFTGDASEYGESVTLILTSDNSSGTSPLPVTIQGLFAPKPWVNVSGITSATLNGTSVDVTYLSDIVLRQPTRVEAIRYIKDPNMTVDEFLSIQVKYQFIGIWGQVLDEISYSLSQYQKEDNFKDTPLTINKGLVLDGNTGITLENIPDTPAGAIRRYILVLYTSYSTTPGRIIGGRRPPIIKIRRGGSIPRLPITFFDEEEEDDE